MPHVLHPETDRILVNHVSFGRSGFFVHLCFEQKLTSPSPRNLGTTWANQRIQVATSKNGPSSGPTSPIPPPPTVRPSSRSPFCRSFHRTFLPRKSPIKLLHRRSTFGGNKPGAKLHLHQLGLPRLRTLLPRRVLRFVSHVLRRALRTVEQL